MIVKQFSLSEAVSARIRAICSTLLIFIAIASILYLGVNWPAAVATTRYAIIKPTPHLSASPQAQTSAAEHDTGNSVQIDSLGIEAPIVLNTPIDAVPEALERGVAHLAGTSLPGYSGNSVLIGHSSDYVWKHNPYGTVFTLLPHIKTGDRIVVTYANRPVTYRVVRTLVVSAEDVGVVDQTTDSRLTLITCYPIGTALKRYIVQAELLDVPLGAAPTSTPGTGSILFH